MGSLIGTVGSAFVGLLTSIAGALSSTVFGIPVALIVGAAAIALGATIAGIVGNLGGKYSTSNSSYVGTPEYNASTGSTTSASGYYSNTSSGSTSSSDLQGAVYNGCYNAFLDIFQRYGDEITGGKEVRLFIDGKQITASVESSRLIVECKSWVRKCIAIKEGTVNYASSCISKRRRFARAFLL